MTVDVVRFAQIVPTPWKNGLGTTTQLAIHPAGASAEDFEWRVSIARVATAAPFSIFPDVSRTLAVLEGQMRLVGLAQPAILTPNSPPLDFAGAAMVQATVLEGPVLDLNVMYRTARWRARMSRMRWTAATRRALRPGEMLCSLVEHLQIRVNGAEFKQLARFDLLSVANTVEIEVGHAQPAEAYLIEFRPLSG